VPLNTFLSYSHEDKKAKLLFDLNLTVMKKKKFITHWHDGLIEPGMRWKDRGAAAVLSLRCLTYTPGNPAGRPNDPQSQALTLELALRVLESAPEPRTTVQSPLRWSADPAWKLDFSNIALLSPEEIARRRAEFDRQKDIAKTIRSKPEAAE
jgi:hypothetical protein